MSWIVLGEDKGKIKLISKSAVTGLLPKGSFLTIESSQQTKHILRVDQSIQNEPYSPSPIIIDMDLSALIHDQKCQNIISAFRVKDISDRIDGLIDFIRPQSIARRSTQSEIDIALGSKLNGPKVFPATIHAGQNQLLLDNDSNFITASLPEDMYYHQILICGKTGSGKTVASKYLAQYFVEEMIDEKSKQHGAVLAINVKDVDFLMLDKETQIKDTSKKVLEEWKNLGVRPKGVDNFTIYSPANINSHDIEGINHELCQSITLNVHEIEPEALNGLLTYISDIGAQNFPNIFRYWQQKVKDDSDGFSNFVKYFNNAINDDRLFKTLNTRGEESEVTLHRGTFDNIIRNLDTALEFFDNPNAKSLNERDILSPGKLSVINVAGNKGIQFGSILLRHLLHKIVEAKDQKKSDVPILIIIDEVHQFYNTDSSKEALGDIDTICRTGRSKKIGVIFSSQNPTDIPRGLSSVINTKIFFKTDIQTIRNSMIDSAEMETLDKGYAFVNIHDMSQLKIVKFPLSLCGVIE